MSAIYLDVLYKHVGWLILEMNEVALAQYILVCMHWYQDHTRHDHMTSESIRQT